MAGPKRQRLTALVLLLEKHPLFYAGLKLKVLGDAQGNTLDTGRQGIWYVRRSTEQRWSKLAPPAVGSSVIRCSPGREIQEDAVLYLCKNVRLHLSSANQTWHSEEVKG